MVMHVQVPGHSRAALWTPTGRIMSAAAGPPRVTKVGSVADAFSVVDDKDVEGIAVGVLGDVRFVMRVVDLVRFGRLCGERN